MINKVLVPLWILLILLTAATAFGEQGLAGEVLSEINLARTRPQVYAGLVREFRRQFRGKDYRLPDSNTFVRTEEGVNAVDEAIRFLYLQKPLPPLAWSDGLAAAAAELVAVQSSSGATGHGRTKELSMRTRIERYGTWQREIGENIGYGPAEARLMVMQLIIDDGVPGRGHRKNTFKPAFTTAGVAWGTHPRFREMCVIEFAGGFAERKEN